MCLHITTVHRIHARSTGNQTTRPCQSDTHFRFIPPRRRPRLSYRGSWRARAIAAISRAGRPPAVITKVKPKTKRPNLYRVLILNDDYTPMEFVVHVLEKFFQKNADAATEIMLHVHHHGIGECGVFTYEIAETKVTPGDGFCAQASASAAMRDGKDRSAVAFPTAPQAFHARLKWARVLHRIQHRTGRSDGTARGVHLM